MALTERGVALGFGRGDSGQLGRGNFKQGNELGGAVRLMQEVVQKKPKRRKVNAKPFTRP